jgi:hypothetical protein
LKGFLTKIASEIIENSSIQIDCSSIEELQKHLIGIDNDDPINIDRDKIISITSQCKTFKEDLNYDFNSTLELRESSNLNYWIDCKQLYKELISKHIDFFDDKAYLLDSLFEYNLKVCYSEAIYLAFSNVSYLLSLLLCSGKDGYFNSIVNS